MKIPILNYAFALNVLALDLSKDKNYKMINWIHADLVFVPNSYSI